MTRHGLTVLLIASLAFAGWTGRSAADDNKQAQLAQPASERFAADTDEVPDMRRHIVPLLGRVGCNGRACHGSFQGRGGFRLSLFGYDFEADRKAMLGSGDEGENRVNLEQPAESLLLKKPTLDVDHEGGDRLTKGSWQYRVLHKWIAARHRVAEDAPQFRRLEVTPSEIVFEKSGEQVQLNVIVHWADGSREDVTCLCRFKCNSDQVADVDENGLVTAKQPGDTHVVAFYDNGVQPVPVIQPTTDQAGKNYPDVATPTEIDGLVVQKLRKLGIVPSGLATDAEFLRRASLDITGSLPAPDEVEAFLADTSSDKRAKKIDELLERPGYAAWWATRLCDMTGNNDDTLNNVTPVRNAASQQWYDWIRRRVADNTPYDELAAGIVLATSREDGEDFKQFSTSMSELYQDDGEVDFAERSSMPHYWARRTFRDPKDRAISFAYTFMGIRIQCAQCHKHPFDQWTKQDFEDFTGFFAGINFGTDPRSRQEYDALLKELKIEGRGNQVRNSLRNLLQEGKTVPFQEVYVVPPRRNTGNARGRARGGRGGRAESATLLGGEKLDLNEFDDPREPLMAWLREKNNRFFAKAFVNRVWAGYFNVGIVEPPDDLSLANPPSNKPLLDYLTDQFIERGFDMKWLHREIAGSDTYQRSWRPNETNQLDERNFSRAVPRRMPAEVAYDALQLATSSNEEFGQKVTDVDGRAITIPGAGRRGAQSRTGPGYALSIFGRSVRESNCDCDRSSEASLLQTVFLHNDQEVFAMIDRRNGGWMNDVAGELGVRNRPVAAQPNANGQRQLQAARQQLARARRANDKALVERLQRRLRALQQRLGTNVPAEGSAAAEKVEMDPTAVVKQAYLRTLSRYPTDEEIARCNEYIEDSKDTLNGVRGVLWALLNTKEFIVNH